MGGVAIFTYIIAFLVVGLIVMMQLSIKGVKTISDDSHKAFTIYLQIAFGLTAICIIVNALASLFG